ncbi:MAG: EamA family transporter RarD [Anaerolineae bacterium]|nr:EamA family transporter RarD [Anaerolineae bacterium]
MNKGIGYAAVAYISWAFLPIYWKSLDSVPALEIVGHRIIWSFGLVLAILIIRNDWKHYQDIVQSPKILIIYLVTASLLGINWLTFVWAINAGFIVESSLGYFINPLVNVLLGVIFLREKLRYMQWMPIGIALIGVLYLSVSYGSLPWIALTLAFSFGLYGLIKKTAPLSSFDGFALETGIMFLPALSYLLYLRSMNRGFFLDQSTSTSILLFFAGLVTGIPLLLFGAGARRIRLSTLGLLQYITPTGHFFVGILIYGEDFSHEKLIGFGIIWFALAIYSLEGIINRRQNNIILNTAAN